MPSTGFAVGKSSAVELGRGEDSVFGFDSVAAGFCSATVVEVVCGEAAGVDTGFGRVCSTGATGADGCAVAVVVVVTVDVGWLGFTAEVAAW